MVDSSNLLLKKLIDNKKSRILLTKIFSQITILNFQNDNFTV